ncbi:MAG: GNAT family N-acetyltransferase [Saprospiraceae bacterium]
MNPIITTKRLILRELNYDDVDGIFTLDSDPKVHEFLGNRPLVNLSQCVEIIDKVRQQYTKFGIGRWAMIEKESGEFVGWCGLKYVTEPFNKQQSYYDLGYRLIQKYWGKGYAKESSKAALHYGFDAMKLKEIYAMAHVKNNRSIAIINGLGFVNRGTLLYDQSEHYWFTITEHDFKLSNSML